MLNQLHDHFGGCSLWCHGAIWHWGPIICPPHSNSKNKYISLYSNAIQFSTTMILLDCISNGYNKLIFGCRLWYMILWWLDWKSSPEQTVDSCLITDIFRMSRLKFIFILFVFREVWNLISNQSQLQFPPALEAPKEPCLTRKRTAAGISFLLNSRHIFSFLGHDDLLRNLGSTRISGKVAPCGSGRRRIRATPRSTNRTHRGTYLAARWLVRWADNARWRWSRSRSPPSAPGLWRE